MLSALEVLDRYYLEARCLLLELGATLDRLDAARDRDGLDAVESDGRLEKIFASLTILADREAPPDRAERMLRLFSDPAN